MGSTVEENAPARATEAVVRDHLRCRDGEELDVDLERNYDSEVRLMSAEGLHRGHGGVRELNVVLRRHIPEGDYDYINLVTDGRFAFLQWHATSQDRLFNGADTFEVRNGLIVLQTVHFHGADRSWTSSE